MSTKPKIQDAGEKLGGARKDMAPTSAPTNTAGTNTPGTDTPPARKLLEELWPRPAQWTDLIPQLGGLRAALVMAIYERLAKMPHRHGWFNATAQQWDAAYRQAITTIREVLWMSPDLTKHQLSEIYTQRMLTWGQEEVGNLNTADLWRVAIGHTTSRGSDHPFTLNPADGLRAKYLPTWGWGLDERVGDRLAFGALEVTYKNDARKAWKAVKGTARHWEYLDQRDFANEEDALACARGFVDKLLEEQEAEKANKAKAPKGSKGPKAPPPPTWARPKLANGTVRSGFATENSNGRTEQDLIKTFGFRGVEFGNWVSQNERQHFVDAIYDAFQDLTQLLGMPAHFASLGGKLGLGYGSRGKGLSKAAAHFEPGSWVLHFTKEHGPGSVSHEFANALDCWVADQLWSAARQADNLAYGHPAKAANAYFPAFASEQMRWERQPREIRESAVAKALGAWFAQIRKPASVLWDWVKDSYAMDANRKGKSYWTQHCEIFARAFEVLVHDSLQHRQQHNNMLVYGITEEDGTAATEQGKPFPYPLGEERAQTCQVLAQVIRAYKAEYKDRLPQERLPERQLEFAL